MTITDTVTDAAGTVRGQSRWWSCFLLLFLLLSFLFFSFLFFSFLCLFFSCVWVGQYGIWGCNVVVGLVGGGSCFVFCFRFVLMDGVSLWLIVLEPKKSLVQKSTYGSFV